MPLLCVFGPIYLDKSFYNCVVGGEVVGEGEGGWVA